jgi:hypothetical protein
MTTTEVQTNTGTDYKIPGTYSIQDIKYDVLKIINPYDGYMFNKKDTDHVRNLIECYLRDLTNSRKIIGSNINSIVKDTTITYDLTVKINHDRSPKKLKIHVGRLVK